MLIPGLARAEDGSVVIVEKEAEAMREAVAMRGRGATYREIRATLRERGIDRSQAAVSELLRNRQLIGEYRFGRHTLSRAEDHRGRGRVPAGAVDHGAQGTPAAFGASARTARGAALPLRPTDGGLLAEPPRAQLRELSLPDDRGLHRAHVDLSARSWRRSSPTWSCAASRTSKAGRPAQREEAAVRTALAEAQGGL